MKTEESIRILLSLYVTIKQNFEALAFYEKYLLNDVLENSKIPNIKEDSIDDTIIESLWFQIIIKSCSFMEEWDKFLAIKTDINHRDKLLLIKRIVSPVRKEINKWKDLKKFRNEVIAHNFRNNDGKFSLDEIYSYNCPNTIEELYYLISFLEIMTKVLSMNFKEYSYQILSKSKKILNVPQLYKGRSSEDLKEVLVNLKQHIDDEIWSLVRFNMLNANSPIH